MFFRRKIAVKIELTDNLGEVISVIKDAFQVPPWNIPEMPESEIMLRLNMFLPCHCHILAAVSDSDINKTRLPSSEVEMAGIAWFGVTRRGEIPDEVTRHIAAIVPRALQVYYGATAVRRSWQGKGVATALKENALKRITHLYPGYVLVTRMRSDNKHIIRINQTRGFVPCGIIETTAEGVRDEWWFKTNF